ncbi:MAG: acyltransferase [Candidatus Omnitrophica bacterium]|nr:acyltransferase [Candidatus Omnitrophota bacterium]
MIDLGKVTVNRLKDKASPTHCNLMDRLRSFLMRRHPRITAGVNVVFKRNVRVSICETGRLSVGDHSLFNEDSCVLLTMPKPQVELGKWVFIGRNTIITCKNLIKIGDFTSLAPNCYLIDHEHGFSADDLIHNQRAVISEITIGRDCLLGAGVTVLGGVHIGDGAVIGAGSVVTKDVPSYQIWAGNPARFLKSRA